MYIHTCFPPQIFFCGKICLEIRSKLKDFEAVRQPIFWMAVSDRVLTVSTDLIMRQKLTSSLWNERRQPAMKNYLRYDYRNMIFQPKFFSPSLSFKFPQKSVLICIELINDHIFAWIIKTFWWQYLYTRIYNCQNHFKRLRCENIYLSEFWWIVLLHFVYVPL